MKILRRRSSPRPKMEETSLAIEMHELGAEISMSTSSSSSDIENEDPCSTRSRSSLEDVSLATPTKSKYHMESLKSLVDAEATPSPQRFLKPQNSPLSTRAEGGLCDSAAFPTCCGVTEWSSPSRSQSSLLQLKILSLLESAVMADCWTHGWQVWSMGNMDSEDMGTSSAEIKAHVQRSLRNRVFSGSGRKLHLSELKRSLNLQKPASLVKTTSYQPIVSENKQAAASTNVWGCEYDCTVNTVTAPPRDFSIPNECYDSDPEESYRSPSKGSSSPRRSKHRLSHNYSIPSDLYDEDQVSECMKHIMNDEWSLLLHRDCSGNTAKRMPSYLPVVAWMDRGQHLVNQSISPRFAWKSTLKTKARLSERHDTEGVDLLDVHRVLEIEKVDRLRYPFARKSGIFVVKTIDDQSYMFEAKSSSERDLIVKALRLVVSRFASKLLTQHGDMSEFFGDGNDPSVLTHQF